MHNYGLSRPLTPEEREVLDRAARRVDEVLYKVDLLCPRAQPVETKEKRP